jgi:hypothetical protein
VSFAGGCWLLAFSCWLFAFGQVAPQMSPANADLSVVEGVLQSELRRWQPPLHSAMHQKLCAGDQKKASAAPGNTPAAAEVDETDVSAWL